LVSAKRNLEVDAWDVRVEARFDPAEEISCTPEIEQALAEAGADEDGVVIGRLDALMVHVWPVRNRKSLLDLLEVNDGDGNTWDAYEEVRSSASALTRWVRTGAGDGLFHESEEPIQTVMLSRSLEVDPFVDRGALLGVMVQHLTAFSPNRILLAHEEPIEMSLPADQRGRDRERGYAFLSVGGRVGFGRYMSLPPKLAQAAGSNPLQRLLSGTEGRPLLIASVLPDGPDYPEWTVWDDLEIEMIDVAEWARLRLGVELELGAGEDGDDFMQTMSRRGRTHQDPISTCSKAGVSVSGSKS
jgi:hypothetical protein